MNVNTLAIALVMGLLVIGASLGATVPTITSTLTASHETRMILVDGVQDVSQ